MASLELKVPPPLVALCLAACMWGAATVATVGAIPFQIRVMGSVLLLVLGQAVAVAGMVAFRRAKTTINPTAPGKATALVASGIYRYTRNPMYLGWLITLLAWSVFLASPVAIVFVPLFVLYINRFQIAPEERALVSLFGAEYAAYSNKVRRWL